MTCIKTGAHVFLEEYDEWAYGDMHIVGSVYVFRVAQVEFGPIYSVMHFTVHSIANWFKDQPYGTIIATSVTDHGYDGIPV